jgi:hypothetical protein
MSDGNPAQRPERIPGAEAMFSAEVRDVQDERQRAMIENRDRLDKIRSILSGRSTR